MEQNLRNDFITSFRSNINPSKLNASKTELIIRCPYCGDSRKDKTHAHLYISLNDDLFYFYCQRCSLNGVVDSEFLKDVKLYDYSLMTKLEIYNKQSFNKKKSRKHVGGSSDNGSLSRIISRDKLILPSFRSSKLNDKKYKYLDDRYSFTKDPQEYIDEYKVIFSFKDFITINEIDYLNAGDMMIKSLVNSYIGFLSSDQSHIIFRNVEPDCPKNNRYYMYNIFNDPTGKRMYTPTFSVDVMQPKINLVVAEGPFDIIGIKEYFYKDKLDNTLFSAVNGKGYSLIMNYFARLGFMDMNINIYSDKDVDLSKYKYLKRDNSVMKNNKVRVFYNTIGKDYGTLRNEIELKSNFI